MKLVFLAVSLITAFMVDCRSQPGPDSQLPIIAEQRQQTQGPFFTFEPNQAEETPITDGTPEESSFTPGFDSEEDKELSESELRGSGCKAKLPCSIPGGYCVDNATHCPGRLIPHGCKGSCQCCIPECPDEPSNITSTTFIAPGTHQCMRIFLDRYRNWTQSKEICEHHGMELAHPYNAIGLRSYLIQKFGYYMGFSWLNARGYSPTGSYLRWQDNNQYILNYDPLWYPYGSTNRSSSYCLTLAANTYYWYKNKTAPYMANPCRYSSRALCELKLKWGGN